MTLWYDQPAKICMNEALPIGNGRLGAMIFGDTAAERIVLNEDSLWTGDENPSGDYGENFGAYQLLGELHIALPGHEHVERYRRSLDISIALAHVSYELKGVRFNREMFASHPANVLAMRFTCEKKGEYTGNIEFVDGHGASIQINGKRLTCAGALSNGLKYETQLSVLNDGGSVQRGWAQIPVRQLQCPDHPRRRTHGLCDGFVTPFSRRCTARSCLGRHRYGQANRSMRCGRSMWRISVRCSIACRWTWAIRPESSGPADQFPQG